MMSTPPDIDKDRDYESEAFAEADPLSLRIVWFLTGLHFLGVDVSDSPNKNRRDNVYRYISEKPPRRDIKSALEAFYNVIRPCPSITWRTGARLFTIHFDD